MQRFAGSSVTVSGVPKTIRCVEGLFLRGEHMRVGSKYSIDIVLGTCIVITVIHWRRACDEALEGVHEHRDRCG